MHPPPYTHTHTRLLHHHRHHHPACAYLQDLMNIAKTTLSSKILTVDKEHFSNLAVDAVMRLKVRPPGPPWRGPRGWGGGMGG